MAARSKKNYRMLDYIDLVKHAHTNPGAQAALDTYHRLQASGVSRPEIQYSEFNGYRVRDPNYIPPRT